MREASSLQMFMTDKIEQAIGEALETPEEPSPQKTRPEFEIAEADISACDNKNEAINPVTETNLKKLAWIARKYLYTNRLNIKKAMKQFDQLAGNNPKRREQLLHAPLTNPNLLVKKGGFIFQMIQYVSMTDIKKNFSEIDDYLKKYDAKQFSHLLTAVIYATRRCVNYTLRILLESFVNDHTDRETLAITAMIHACSPENLMTNFEPVNIEQCQYRLNKFKRAVAHFIQLIEPSNYSENLRRTLKVIELKWRPEELKKLIQILRDRPPIADQCPLETRKRKKIRFNHARADQLLANDNHSY